MENENVKEYLKESAEVMNPKVIEKLAVDTINMNETGHRARILASSQTSNLLYEPMTHSIIDSVFRTIVDSVSHTLGVYGRNSLIISAENQSTFIRASKDGRDNAKEVRWDNEIPTHVAGLIRGIINHMQTTVGDSTTSGLPIAYSLYKNLYNGLKKKQKTELSISPAGISNILEEIENYFDKNLFNKEDIEDNNPYQRIINWSDKEQKISILSRVGKTSANGNGKIANKVASLFKNKENEYDTYVQLEASPLLGTEDTIVDEKGFELDSGMLSKAFSTEADGMTAIHENARIAVFSGPILDSDKDVFIQMITGITYGAVRGVRVRDAKDCEPLIIIADGFSPSIEALALRFKSGVEASKQEFVFDNAGKKIPVPGSDPKNPKYLTKEVPFYAPIVLMRMDNKYEDNKELLQDLRTAVGAGTFETLADKLTVNVDLTKKDIFEKTILFNLGKCSKFTATPQSCAILGGVGHKDAVESRINLLEKEYQSYMTNSKLKPSTVQSNAMRRRISMLKSSIGKIVVGGANATEKETKLSVYDDVVRSIRTTIINNGVALSGNLGVVHYIKYNIDKITEDISKILIDDSMNVCLGNKEEDVKKLVKLILEMVSSAFETSYKRSLLNALSTSDEEDTLAVEKVDEIYNKCLVNSEYPQAYNLSTDKYESLNDFENCTLLVPRNTDKELMYCIFSVIKQFITTEKMITLAPLSIDLKALMSAFNERVSGGWKR